MQKDYCEILLTAIDMMQQSAELSRVTIASDIQVNTDPEKILLSTNPLEDMVQQEAASFQAPITLDSNNATQIFTWMLHSQSRYDRLGIKTLVTTDKVTQGSYGIQLTVYSSSKVYTVQLDSSDMLGDVFNFSDMLQKKIFDLTGASNIQAIKIQCYNNTNGTVTFSNTQVAIGYLLEQYGPNSEPLVLYVDSDDKKETNLTYTTSGGEVIENSEITLCVRWIYQDGVSYRAVTHHNPEDFPKGCSIRWYRYTPDNPGGDQYGGSYWRYMPLDTNENPFKRTLGGFNPSAENEQFKVVVLQGSLAGGIAATSSNIVKITNIISGAVEILTNRKILFDDGTNGIYPWYAFDDILAEDYSYESSINRTLHLSYNSKLSNEDTLQKIRKITWKLPSDFMNYKADTFDEIIEEDGYKIIVRNYDELESLDNIFITYTIRSEIYDVATAKVQCILTMDDNIDYIFEHEVNFSHTFGGTDNSVVVRLCDASGKVHPAINIDTSNDIEYYYIVPKVYNIDGTLIEGATYSAQLIITNSEDGTNTSFDFGDKNENGTAFALLEKDATGKETKIDFSLNTLAFIKFIFTISNSSTSEEGNTKFRGDLQLEEWFGLPIAKLEAYAYKGPKRIVYNSSGVDPQYNKTKLQVVNDNDSNGQIWTTIGYGEYNENTESTEETESKNYFETHNELFPIVRDNIIRPCHAFDKIIGTGTSYFGVYCADKWLQPIAIYQNRYFSRIINDWDGSLKIDEDNNYILSSSYVAGGKDEQNTFTGLIMGELGTISDEISDKKLNSTETGLFGYHKGAQSFGFRTNGSAFLGESGGGRINFDGNQGIIYSGNFDGFPKIKDEEGNETTENDTSVSSENVSAGTQGTYLNLKDGLFITSNGNFRGKITALEGDIANWVIGEQALYATTEQMVEGNVEILYTGLGIYSDHEFILKYDETIGGYTIVGYNKAATPKSKIIIPSKINGIPIINIGDQAFANYNTLTDLIISSGVKKIGKKAFYNCNNLFNIYIPASIEMIDEQAFYYQQELPPRAFFWIQTTQEDFENNVIDKNWSNPTSDFQFEYGCSIENWEVIENLGNNSRQPRFYAGAQTNPPIFDATTDRPNAKFLVAADGTLYATGANIQGAITSDTADITGKVTAIEGKIGKWQIGDVPKDYLGDLPIYIDSLYSAVAVRNQEDKVTASNLLVLAPYQNSSNMTAMSIVVKRATDATHKEMFNLKYDGSVRITKGTIGNWSVDGSLYTSAYPGGPKPLLNLYDSDRNVVFLGSQEIHICGTTTTDNATYEQNGYYSVLKPGVIINTMQRHPSLGDTSIIMDDMSIKFFDLYDKDNSLKDYTNSNDLPNINTGSNTRNYGYIGQDPNFLSRPFTQGLIKGFNIDFPLQDSNILLDSQMAGVKISLKQLSDDEKKEANLSPGMAYYYLHFDPYKKWSEEEPALFFLGIKIGEAWINA